jgi:hypothetical protein
VPSSTSAPAQRRVNDEQIRDALRTANYNYSAAAEALGIHRSTLYERTRANQDGSRGRMSDEEVLAGVPPASSGIDARPCIGGRRHSRSAAGSEHLVRRAGRGGASARAPGWRHGDL